MKNPLPLVFLALFFTSASAVALEIDGCEATEQAAPAGQANRSFRVVAQLRNETDAVVAKAKPGVIVGHMFEGDCSKGGGSQTNPDLDADIPAKGTGSVRNDIGIDKRDHGKARLLFFVTTDADGEAEALKMAGNDCGFETRKIRNPRRFKACRKKEAR